MGEVGGRCCCGCGCLGDASNDEGDADDDVDDDGSCIDMMLLVNRIPVQLH